MEDINQSKYLDDVFDALSKPKIRHILNHLKENNYSTGEQIIESLEEQTEGDANYKTELYHSHLPRLKDTGWIDYDERPGSVEDFDVIFDVEEDDEKDALVLSYLDQVTDEEDDEEVNRFFSSLNAPIGRRTLYWLNEEEGKSNLDQIATYLAADTSDAEVEDFDAAERRIRSVKSELLHNYLPKLEDSGVIRYDEGSEKISFTDEYSEEDNLLIQFLERVYD